MLNNYVSKLTFVLQILEMVVSKQLEEHLVNNKLMDVLRSAYRAKRILVLHMVLLLG